MSKPELPNNIRIDLQHLLSCLRALPTSIPLSTNNSRINLLLEFHLEDSQVADIGEEGAYNRELEVAFFENRRNERGVFNIDERGPAIEALPGILKDWLGKYPTSVIALKWLQDAITSVEECLRSHGCQVCI